ncbi:hypothetical protein, partial [Exiguobacterium aurantiacum]|uniref:hypothetical protein n=1 Tax=Exiguobacterium aurantiacum TaxID=33987 RepID=UPI001E314B87
MDLELGFQQTLAKETGVEDQSQLQRQGVPVYLDLCLIFLLLRFSLRIRFFRHFALMMRRWFSSS